LKYGRNRSSGIRSSQTDNWPFNVVAAEIQTFANRIREDGNDDGRTFTGATIKTMHLSRIVQGRDLRSTERSLLEIRLTCGDPETHILAIAQQINSHQGTFPRTHPSAQQPTRLEPKCARLRRVYLASI
jgi:hypothetical protein